MINKKRIDIARNNWKRAAQELGFKIITPYSISVGKKGKEVFGFLPEYGSSNGTIIELTCGPEFETDKQIIEFATENNFYYSFINVESILEYNQEYYKEILEDWMKYGIE